MLRIGLYRPKKPSTAINFTHQHSEVEEARDSEEEVGEAQDSEDEAEEPTPRPKRATNEKSQQVLTDEISELAISEDPDWAMNVCSENDDEDDEYEDDELDRLKMMDVDLDVPRSKSTAAGKANNAKPQSTKQSTAKTGDEKAKEKQDDIRSAVMAGRQKKPSAVGCHNNFPVTV